MEQENLGTIIMDDVLLLCKLNKAFESQLILIAQSRMNTQEKGEKMPYHTTKKKKKSNGMRKKGMGMKSKPKKKKY